LRELRWQNHPPSPSGRTRSAGESTGPDSLTNIPPPHDTLVGRSSELAELTARLSAPGVVSVVGPGGVGKTRLAREAATASDARFPDGRWLVALATMDQEAAAVLSLAAAAGDPAQGAADIGDLVDRLGGQRLLVVLDGGEQQAETWAGMVGRLVGAAGATTVIYTGRRPLGMAGERVIRLAPLAVPSAEGTAPAAFDRCDSVRLFLQSARSAVPEAVFTADDALLVARICRASDGLPADINAAATALARLSLERLVEVAEGGLERAPAADQIDHAAGGGVVSEEDRDRRLLTPSEARLLDRLSVFSGGWTLESALAVCGEAGPEGGDLASLHATLVANSLVLSDAETSRYRMLGVTRRAAKRVLAQAGGYEALSRRHAQWCLSLVEGDAADLVAVADEAWLRRLDPELENLRAALAWARDEGDAQTGIHLVSALVKYWEFRGHLHEALEWVGWAMAQDHRATPALLRATVVRRAAVVHSRLGDAKGAQALAEQATVLYRGIGDAEGAAATSHFISLCRSPSRALTALDESVGLARAAGEVNALAHLLCTRGQAQFFLGNLGAARADFGECLALGRREGHGDALLLGLLGLARVDLLAGDLPTAARELGDALALAERADDRPNANIALALSAELRRTAGDYDQARELLELAIGRARADGEPLAIARGLLFLGRLEHCLGDFEAAGPLFAESLALGRSAEAPPYHEARCLHGLAATALASGDMARARGAAQEAAATAAANDDRQAAADAMLIHARLAAVAGELRSALRLAVRSIRSSEALGDTAGLCGGLETVAALLVDPGQAHSAARLFGAAEALRETGGYARPPAEAQGHTDATRALADSLGADWERARMEGRTLSGSEAVAVAAQSIRQVRPNPGRASLTPAEAEVARLVADGLTNAEAAAALFVSRRTVDTHLAHLYAKLGIHSRKELADWAAAGSTGSGAAGT
jgi:predicted ATPase/DNA-binding CsgD family transcriptional regulator